MGQAFSTVTPMKAAALVERAKKLRQVATLSYDEFLERITDLNHTLELFVDSSGSKLTFAVKNGSDSNIMWRSTVRIACLKVDPGTTTVISRKLLNLRQFLHIYDLLATQFSPEVFEDLSDESAVRQAAISTSIIFEGIKDHLGDDSDLCCICMERNNEVTLQCAHSYCMPCIEQWQVNHSTCPECRAIITSSDDTWVISEPPDMEDMAAEIRRTLATIPDET